MAGVMQIDWQGDSALCAWIDGQQVAMLDISKCADGVTVNMLFVKPPFRRRGIGGALLRRLLQCHPQAGAACSDPRLRALLERTT
jgi:GNAT superfamily N-acetyltransferase